VGQSSDTQEYIADKLLTLEGLFKPVRLRIVDPSQLEGSGVSDLKTLPIDQTQVNENPTVFFLEDGQFSLKKRLITKLLQAKVWSSP